MYFKEFTSLLFLKNNNLFLKKNQFFKYIYKFAQETLGGRNIGKYPFMKSLENFVISNAKTDFVNIDGHKMYLDSKDSLNLSIQDSYEKLESDLVKQEVKNEDVVLDVGANIGYYTLLLAKLVGTKGKVFAFEPAPDNFFLLEKNISLNGYKNVVLENLALSNSNGHVDLYLSDESMGWHRIYPSKFCSNNHVKVEMIRLDDYFKNENIRDTISFIKMDVEGAEFGVLKGMTTILKNNKKLTLLLEFVPHYIREFGSNPKDLLNFLDEQGFEIFVIEEKSEQIKLVDNFDILLEKNDICNDLPQRTNLLCKRI